MFQVELLNGNCLAELPAGFGALANMVELHLDENHINSLPNDFGGLKSLQVLDLGQISHYFQHVNVHVVSCSTTLPFLEDSLVCCIFRSEQTALPT